MDITNQKENDADMIIPNLWLGNSCAALNREFIQSANIKYIINVTDNIACPFTDIIYYHIPIKDKRMCDNETRNVMFNYIKHAIETIRNGLQENVGVLVHCRRGHHRSANIILIFLMQYLNMGYIVGLIYINNIRPLSLQRNTCIAKWIINYYREYLIEH